jgi:hypothetical protein
MPTEAADAYTTIYKHGTGTFLARLLGADAAPLARADIAAVRYSVFLLDDQDPDARSAVEGHRDVPLDVAEVLWDALQTDALWTRDALGYNFKHTLNVATHAAFTVAGRRYLVEYRLTPAAGQVLLARFRVNVI